MSKFKDIFRIGTAVGRQFAPPAVGGILDVVSKSIDDKEDAGNTAALKALAESDHEQDQAILALHERLKKAGF